MQEISTFIANHLLLTYAFSGVLVLLMIVEFLRQKRQAFVISTTRAVQLINHDNAAVIDIRVADSYAKGHIIDAQSIPAAELIANTKKYEKLKLRPVIIVCNTGAESQKTAALLLKQGYNVYSLAGGLRAWSAADMPLVP